MVAFDRIAVSTVLLPGAIIPPIRPDPIWPYLTQEKQAAAAAVAAAGGGELVDAKKK